MKTTTVGMYEAKTNFSKLVSRAAAGEEIIVFKPGFDEIPPEFVDALGL